MISLGAFEYNANHANLLGSGAFAFVYKGRVKHKPDEPVAIKIMKKDTNMPKNKTLLSKEISVLKDLNHENIVRLYDHGISNNGVYLVMEYCNAGDLSEYLLAKRTLPEDTIRYFLAQIGSAMDAINRKGFMHRDLKPGNILITHCRNCGQLVTDLPGSKLTFKLADFGFARFLQDGMMAVTMCGSPMYMAPEVLMCRKYDAVADIWSMGVIVYQCLTGTAPFYANNPEALKNIYEKTVNLRPKIPQYTNPLLCDLLLRMLVRKPSERIDFDKFLNHPFLKQRHFDGSGVSNRNRDINAILSTPRHKPDQQPPSLDPTKPVIVTMGMGTRDGAPFYLGSKTATTEPASQLPNRSDLAAVDSHEPSIDMPGLDDMNDEMSRTTVDEYFEDPLDTSALQLEPPHHYDVGHIGEPHNTGETPRPCVVAPPVPVRGSSVTWKIPDSRHPAVQTPRTHPPFLGVKTKADAPLEDFVIVNRDGSEVDGGPRRTAMPTVPISGPMSNIGRILTNPNSYRPTSQPRQPQTTPPTLPDVASVGVAPPSTHQPTNVNKPSVRLVNRPPSYPAASSTQHQTVQIRTQPLAEPTEVKLRTTRNTEAGNHRKASYPPAVPATYSAHIADTTTNGTVQQVWFLTDEQLMDSEHNEEIKTITMVLELCELLVDLAEQRASILTDCTVTTTSTSSNPSNEQLDNPSSAAAKVSDNIHSKAPAASSEDSVTANSSSTPGLKFLPEARRIVEQIVLYRRVLYYLEYVFAQVKKAFLHGRLKSTVVSRKRLTDCNALYHRCYIRLRQVARQSRRDDLIEPIGRLLASISANRLIFKYALTQCEAAEIDEYEGDLDQSVQRYKAGITMLHGLRQHAKSAGDTTLLAECMRLLHERHNTLRLAALKQHQQQTPAVQPFAQVPDSQGMSPQTTAQ